MQLKVTKGMSVAEYRQLIGVTPKKPAKYRNEKVVVVVDGQERKIDSKKEARVYAELQLGVKRGEVFELETQPVYPITVNGHVVCKVQPDFRYKDRTGRLHVIDVKSAITRKNPTYRLKKKLFKAIYGFDIEER